MKNVKILSEHTLAKGGFQEVALWMLCEDHIKLSEDVSKEPSVYAFSIAEEICYIGVATKSLAKRLKFYCKPGKSQSTNIRLNTLIKGALLAGKSMKILAAFPENDEWNGLPVDVVAGLEIGLISKYKPAWNIQGV